MSVCARACVCVCLSVCLSVCERDLLNSIVMKFLWQLDEFEYGCIPMHWQIHGGDLCPPVWTIWDPPLQRVGGDLTSLMCSSLSCVDLHFCRSTKLAHKLQERFNEDRRIRAVFGNKRKLILGADCWSGSKVESGAYLPNLVRPTIL